VRWPFRRVARKENPVGPIIASAYLNRAVWTERRYEQLAEESYLRNAVAFKCTKLIATNAAMVPWLLSDKSGKEIETHPLLDLLSRPAPMVGGHALFEAYYAYLMLSGNSYLVGQALSGNRPPKELWNLRPDRTKVVPGPYGVPAAFEYEVNGQKKTFPTDPLTGAGDVLHVKEFHPINDWYGLGRVEPAAYGIDRHNAASAINKALMDNGARPSGALIFNPIKGANGSEQSAPTEVIQQAEADLRASHGGPEKAGVPFVFGGNVKWEEMGISPRDMDFAAGKEDAARDICTAFGVPHILIVPGQSTYNNVSEAKLELWEETILPLMDRTVDALNAWLTPRYGDGLRLGVDLDEVSALEPRRESKRKSTVDLLNAGIIDDTEARDALQYGPREKGAVKKVDAQVLAALIVGASKDGAMAKPLFTYLQAVGLLDPSDTLNDFVSAWSSGAITAADLVAALPPPPAKLPASAK
jgi:HK97 family phage portal protein